MKRRELEKKLRAKGFYPVETGHDNGDHDVWTNGKHKEPIPRHREIKEGTAKKIIKRCGLE
jgi:predicted RNA binding protein YcfA (HicA-like mRNA interferase family)